MKRYSLALLQELAVKEFLSGFANCKFDKFGKKSKVTSLPFVKVIKSETKKTTTQS